jgi:AcrR family transcriptional regulator
MPERHQRGTVSMRYPREYKRQARRSLLEHGGSHAKQHGFAGSGMDAIAAAAGVTTGSLYKHFAGKSELFAAIVRAELERMTLAYGGIPEDDAHGIARAIAGYLSMKHVSHPEQGCVLPSLTPEVARSDTTIRAAFQQGMLELHAILERRTGSKDSAWALVAQMVGAVMLARAMVDEKVQRELLAAAKREAQALLGASTK